MSLAWKDVQVLAEKGVYKVKQRTCLCQSVRRVHRSTMLLHRCSDIHRLEVRKEIGI